MPDTPRRRLAAPLLLLTAGAVLLATGTLTAAPPTASAQPAAAGAHARRESGWLTDAARHYRAWGRVDDELRWAPFLCRMPMPSAARVSRAGGDGEHARKVYFVYASDRQAYMHLTRTDDATPPRGLTVVKEAFHPRVLGEGEPRAPRGPVLPQLDLPAARAPQEAAPSATPAPFGLATSPDIYRPTSDGTGALIGAGEARGLYVLRYVGRGARGTDDGWVYGTIDASGEVTAAGRVASCMGCHRSAPRGRLFGLDAAAGGPPPHPDDRAGAR